LGKERPDTWERCLGLLGVLRGREIGVARRRRRRRRKKE